MDSESKTVIAFFALVALIVLCVTFIEVVDRVYKDCPAPCCVKGSE